MKFYLWGSLIGGGFCYMVTLGRFDTIGTPILSTRTRALFSTAILTLYFIFSITSVAYAWRINTRPGMSSGVRQSFITRHMKYVGAYLLTWLPYYGFSFFILFSSSIGPSDVTYQQLDQNELLSKGFHHWLAAWNYACMLTGIFMSCVRITEPIFWAMVSQFAYQFFGELPPEEGQGTGSKVDGTLLSFLMSSLNIELVHIILTTVSKNTVGTPKSLHRWDVYQDYDHTNKNTFVLDSIEIEDRQNWDINMV
jgi:hypothetical protein